MKYRRHTSPSLFIVALFLLSGLAACSDSPTDPPHPGGGEGIGFTDVPDIPRPATPGGEVPARSATKTAIKQFGGTYRPVLTDANGRWEAVEQCGGSSTDLGDFESWGSNLGSNDGLRRFVGSVLGRNLVLQEADGTRVNQARSQTDVTTCYLGILAIPGHVQFQFRGEALEMPVYIRRDRHWELKPLEGGAGNYLLVYPQTSGEVETVYRRGTQTTQTEEFGRSLTAEVGLSYGILSASVSGTLSETFSSSVTMSEEKEESFTKTVSGKEGKIIQFMVWELVEYYTFCDAEGNALTSENYVIAPESVTLRGTSIALQSTEFDLP